MGQACSEIRVGGCVGQVILEIGLRLLQLVLRKEVPPLHDNHVVPGGKILLALFDRFAAVELPFHLREAAVDLLQGFVRLVPSTKIGVHVYETEQRFERVFGIVLQGLPVVEFCFFGLSEIEACVARSLADPPGDGLAGSLERLQLRQGFRHPVDPAERNDVISPRRRIFRILLENRFQFGDGGLVFPPPQLPKGRPDSLRFGILRIFPLSGLGLFVAPHPVEVCGRFPHRKDCRIRENFFLLRFLDGPVRPVGIPQPQITEYDPLESLFVLRIVGPAQAIEVQGLRILPQVVIGPRHMAGHIRDGPKLFFVTLEEVHRLLLLARPAQAQDIVGKKMPVVRKGLQGPLQKGKRLVVAPGLNKLQGFLIVRFRLGRGVHGRHWIPGGWQGQEEAGAQRQGL